MLKRIVICIAFILPMLVCSRAKAQASDIDELARMEDTLSLMADSMYFAFIPDMRPAYCEQFVKKLVKALKVPNSYNYPFDRLKGKINIIYPEDKSFRMFNWVIAPSEMSRRYYAAIQMPGEQLKLYPLLDYSAEVAKKEEDTVLSNTRWYGCLYYRIITHEVDGRPVYTMFGLNEASPISNKKIMDPMVFEDKGPVFGAPIFSIGSKTKPGEPVKRFILEYKKGVQVGLNWDDDLKAVYFDKLVSQINDPNRKYTYVPSGEYDGFKWGNEMWQLVHDLISVQVLKNGEAPSGAPIKPQE
ncbi:MAG: hypothetical protein BGO69_18770 [Bacteroidetes bacterium 46-16]|nr:MAG: hypothetical protein BGO69_18770 [Bacteroidetes bacterium 46-16]